MSIALSKSAIWAEMQEYYQQLGVQLWAEGIVPQQITNNKYLAKFYVSLIINQMESYYQSSGVAPVVGQPFYILELGSGHGRLAFYILQLLEEAMAQLGYPHNSICYLMSDIGHSQLQFWQQHQALRPLVASGRLDFVMFDVLQDCQLTLINQQRCISAASLDKPLTVIANYVFDTLPQDMFLVKDDQLFIYNISSNLNASNAKQQDYFEKTRFRFVPQLVAQPYADSEPLAASFNQILAEYLALFAGKTVNVSLPVGALRALHTLRHFSQQETYVLVADKGLQLVDWFAEYKPEIIKHGSFSMLVNFDAIQRFLRLNAGHAYFTTPANVELQIAGLLLQQPRCPQQRQRQLQLSWQQLAHGLSVIDVFQLCYPKDQPRQRFANLVELLALLQLSNWDANVFFDYHEILIALLEKQDWQLEQEQLARLLAGIQLVGRYYFFLEVDQDLPFVLGLLSYHLGEAATALAYYQQSLAYFGDTLETWYNLALVYQELKQDAACHEAIRQTLLLDADYEAALQLLDELQQETA
jgi:hypothetical protein